MYTRCYFLEGVGHGNEARRRFEQVIEINPVYPQAARLAATYAISYNDAVRYMDLFFDGMKRLEKSKKEEDFPRFGIMDKMMYDKKKSFSSISEDIIAYHSFMYFQMQEQKNTVKQLVFGSLITEIIRSGRNNQTQVPEDIQRGIVRNCIELCIVWEDNIAAKQKEYGQFICPHDNLVLQDALEQTAFYLDKYDPYDVIVINWKANCLFNMKKYEECIRQCDDAIQIQPSGYFRHYLNKSMALLL
jgi:tetratricopeptide (TPR) repeat protein